MVNSFPMEVAAELKWYVYRLIDPRNGETFYVGKGKGDRIFHHIRGAVDQAEDEDIIDLRLKRILAIQSAGLDVNHVIHRHHLEEETAYQVEAALIDAYPGLTNAVAGHQSSFYGARHLIQIIEDYAARSFTAMEPLILISIGRTVQELEPYQAVRAAWKMNLEKASQFRLILAHSQGTVVGVFRPDKWMTDTAENFPWLPDHSACRIGFEGHVAETEVVDQYIRTRVPDHLRKRGAANPIRFVLPED